MDDKFTDDGVEPDQGARAAQGRAAAATRSTTRGQDEDLAKFGQMIFFDKDVAEAITVAGPSGNVGEIRKVACVNCHDTPYFTDSHLTSPGALANNGLVPGLSHGRNYLATNTGQMVNLAWNQWTLWAGTFDSPGRARHDRLGHVGDAARAGALRVHEVQGRVQRGLPRDAARRSAGPADDRSGQRLPGDGRPGGASARRPARSR